MGSFEARQRRDQIAASALKEAEKHVHKAIAYLRESKRALHKNLPDECDDWFRRASERVSSIIQVLAAPTEPGMDAKDLPARTDRSGSVHVPGNNLESFAWMSDARGKAEVHRARAQHSKLEALGLDARKLSSAAILQHLADSGWGPEELAGYVKNLMEVTQEGGTIRQRVEVTKLVFGVLQHTEPRTLFEMKDVDLADLSEDELEELTRRAAEHVAHEAARLQAGLPPSTTE